MNKHIYLRIEFAMSANRHKNNNIPRDPLIYNAKISSYAYTPVSFISPSKKMIIKEWMKLVFYKKVSPFF